MYYTFLLGIYWVGNIFCVAPIVSWIHTQQVCVCSKNTAFYWGVGVRILLVFKFILELLCLPVCYHIYKTNLCIKIVILCNKLLWYNYLSVCWSDAMHSPCHWTWFHNHKLLDWTSPVSTGVTTSYVWNLQGSIHTNQLQLSVNIFPESACVSQYTPFLIYIYNHPSWNIYLRFYAVMIYSGMT